MGSAYCQLIREANKVKTLAWATKYKDEDFSMLSGQTRAPSKWSRTDDIRTEKQEILQRTSLGKFLCSFDELKLYSVWFGIAFLFHPERNILNVWAGISYRGRSGICIFDGIMNAPLYVRIVELTLLPSSETCIHMVTDSCKIVTPSTLPIWPKHTSRRKLWTGGRRLPSLPIRENMWYELKEYFRREVKPKTKEELVKGIQEFWKTVDIQKCRDI